uniref:VHS domain-containing protein n=1 Tax=Macrostomum lignano TaxID=282301 RepID=A0A1I8IFI7_9PLAT
RATDPTNREINWDAVNKFSQQVSKELEGPQIALRLLAHKIHSPQENEALYALAVTEACVRNCGPYLGATSSEAVKKRCIECLYGWSRGLYTEPKIREAYDMLKKQGIISRDPVYIDQTLRSNPYLPLKREKDTAIFNDEKTAQEISRLLKSKRPEDLMAANRLIKSAVKQDNERMDRLSKRLGELETVRNNAQLLSEMLNHYRPTEAVQSDVEIIRELHRTLREARPRLYRLAGETENTDEESMKEVLAVNDLAAEVLKRCTELIGEDQLREASAPQAPSSGFSSSAAAGSAPAASAASPKSSSSGGGGLLIGDMAFDPFDPLSYGPSTSSTASSAAPAAGSILDLPDLPPAYSATPASSALAATISSSIFNTTAPTASTATASTGGGSSGDIDLLSDLFSSASSVAPPVQRVGIAPMVPMKGGGGGASVKPAASSAVPNLALNPSKPSAGTQLQSTSGSTGASAAESAVFKGLDQLGKDFLMRQSPKKTPAAAAAADSASVALLASASNSAAKAAGAAAPNGKPEAAAAAAPVSAVDSRLSSLPPVSVASLRPHPSYSPQPVIQSEPAGPGAGHVTVMLHFAEPDCAPAPGVAALLCAVASTLGQACQDVALTVTCRRAPDSVLTQAPSGTSLPASSPMLPAAAPITQCLLVLDPAEKSLAFSLTYRLAGEAACRTQKSLPVVLPEDLLSTDSP